MWSTGRVKRNNKEIEQFGKEYKKIIEIIKSYKTWTNYENWEKRISKQIWMYEWINK